MTIEHANFEKCYHIYIIHGAPFLWRPRPEPPTVLNSFAALAALAALHRRNKNTSAVQSLVGAGSLSSGPA